MFNTSPLALATVVAVSVALSACTTIERERSSAPPTVVMQPAAQQMAPQQMAPQQPAATVIVR